MRPDAGQTACATVDVFNRFISLKLESWRSDFGLRFVPINRPASLAHQMFRIPFDNVFRNRADTFEPHSFIESLSSPIERRHAQEHIRMFAEDPSFDVFDQQRSNTAIATFRHDAEQMNIAAEWATNVQQHETDDFFALSRNVSFARRVHQWFDAMLVSAAKRDPWFGNFERASADFGFVFAAHAADEDGGCFWHVGAAR